MALWMHVPIWFLTNVSHYCVIRQRINCIMYKESAWVYFLLRNASRGFHNRYSGIQGLCFKGISSSAFGTGSASFGGSVTRKCLTQCCIWYMFRTIRRFSPRNSRFAIQAKDFQLSDTQCQPSAIIYEVLGWIGVQKVVVSAHWDMNSRWDLGGCMNLRHLRCVCVAELFQG